MLRRLPGLYDNEHTSILSRVWISKHVPDHGRKHSSKSRADGAGCQATRRSFEARRKIDLRTRRILQLTAQWSEEANILSWRAQTSAREQVCDLFAKRAGRRRRKVHIFILDHVLLMTELVENENNNNDDDDHFRHSPSFYIKARQLPLQMLAVLTQSQQQQDSESCSVNVSTSSSSGSSSIAGFLSAHMCFPYYHHSSGKQKVTFIHRGRVDLDKQRYQHTFTVGSAQEIEKCLGALEDAKIQRKQCLAYFNSRLWMTLRSGSAATTGMR